MTLTWCCGAALTRSSARPPEPSHTPCPARCRHDIPAAFRQAITCRRRDTRPAFRCGATPRARAPSMPQPAPPKPAASARKPRKRTARPREGDRIGIRLPTRGALFRVLRRKPGKDHQGDQRGHNDKANDQANHEVQHVQSSLTQRVARKRRDTMTQILRRTPIGKTARSKPARHPRLRRWTPHARTAPRRRRRSGRIRSPACCGRCRTPRAAAP